MVADPIGVTDMPTDPSSAADVNSTLVMPPGKGETVAEAVVAHMDSAIAAKSALIKNPPILDLGSVSATSYSRRKVAHPNDADVKKNIMSKQ